MSTKSILDPTSAMRSFYFDKTDKRVLFGDIRVKETHILSNGQTIHVEPDQVMDFRSIPYSDNTFSMVVFDPPHRFNLSQSSDFIKKYRVLTKDSWKADLSQGFKECFRVLKPFGSLVFKWSDVSIKLSEILSLTDEKPILGHPSGKRMTTHWVLFMKAAQ
jgi:hypothetical protein